MDQTRPSVVVTGPSRQSEDSSSGEYLDPPQQPSTSDHANTDVQHEPATLSVDTDLVYSGCRDPPPAAPGPSRRRGRGAHMLPPSSSHSSLQQSPDRFYHSPDVRRSSRYGTLSSESDGPIHSSEEVEHDPQSPRHIDAVPEALLSNQAQIISEAERPNSMYNFSGPPLPPVLRPVHRSSMNDLPVQFNPPQFQPATVGPSPLGRRLSQQSTEADFQTDPELTLSSSRRNAPEHYAMGHGPSQESIARVRSPTGYTADARESIRSISPGTSDRPPRRSPTEQQPVDAPAPPPRVRHSRNVQDAMNDEIMRQQEEADRITPAEESTLYRGWDDLPSDIRYRVFCRVFEGTRLIALWDQNYGSRRGRHRIMISGLPHCRNVLTVHKKTHEEASRIF